MKLLPIILILATLAGGAVFGWHRAGRPDVAARMRGGRAARDPGDGRVAPDPSVRRGPTDPAPGPATPDERGDPETDGPRIEDLPTGRSSAALFDRGEKLFAALEFAEARKAFAEARGSRSPDLYAEARKMEVLSDIFDRATRKIPRLRESAPSEVTLTNGRVVVGYVDWGVDGSVTVRTDQGITATFRQDQYESVEKVETVAWRQRCEEDLAEKLRKVSADLPALDYYQAVYFAIRNGLDERASKILLQCAEADGFELVIETFGGAEAERLVARWDEASDPTGRPTSTRPPTPTPSQPGSGTPADLSQADELYREGLTHYRRSLPGMENAQEELKRARGYFEKAVETYRSAAESQPGNRLLEERIQRLQSLIYDCIKRAQV